MLRIWAKVMNKDKILCDTVFSADEDFDFEKFFTYTAEICHELDIATPVILSKHIFHFLNFHNTTFLPQDFPEEVAFSRLVLEDITE
ncbi:MAG: hypothetical protein ACI4L7_02955 [Christensenellales bacterium]